MMFNFYTRDAFLCSSHSSKRNNVADWNWTTAWPQRQQEGGDAQKLVHAQRSFLTFFYTVTLVCTQKLLRREAFAQRSFYTQKPFHPETVTHRSSCTKKSLYGELQHIDGFTHRNFYTEKPLQRELVDTKAFTHIEIFIYRRAFTPRNFHPKKLFNFTDWSHKQKLLHGKAFAQRRLG